MINIIKLWEIISIFDELELMSNKINLLFWDEK